MVGYIRSFQERVPLAASGDLAPLSHIALGLIGLGKVEYKGETVDAAEALKDAGITPVELAAKEGLPSITAHR